MKNHKGNYEFRSAYTHKKIFMRLGLSFTQTVLDYIYAILSSFQIESIRGILIIFMIFYPFINFIAWLGILGYLDLKYNNLEYKSIKDFFGKNRKRNIQMALIFGLCQIFNLLPFFIYLQIYQNHKAIFTEQLVDLLEQDKQQKRLMNDEERSFITYKTLDQNMNTPYLRKFQSLCRKQSLENQLTSVKREPSKSMNFNSLAGKGLKLNKVDSKEILAKNIILQNAVPLIYNPDDVQSFSGLNKYKKNPTIALQYNSNFRQNLQTQIAIEANCGFSIIAIVEEMNFQMLFEAGEIMEMAFKSFPMFAIQLCNNILQNNWALYWFTILYFCILLIRMFVVGLIFVKFLLLNDRMIKFLENVRYFNEEMGDGDIKIKNNYPMPEILTINQLSTLKRMADLSTKAAKQVKQLYISVSNEPKQQDIILKGVNSSISKNNKLGSKKISDITSFLIQGLTECKDVSLFFDGNDLAEEELNSIKTKFDNNQTAYDRFYFQSEQMVIIYDNTQINFLAKLQMFYRRFYIEIDENDLKTYQESLRLLTLDDKGFDQKESEDKDTKDKDSQSPPEQPIENKFQLYEKKIKQLYIIVPKHTVNPEEQKLLLKIFQDIYIGYLEVQLDFEDQNIQNKLQEEIWGFSLQGNIQSYEREQQQNLINKGTLQCLKMGSMLNTKIGDQINSKYPQIWMEITNCKYNYNIIKQIQQYVNIQSDQKPISIVGSKGLSKMLDYQQRLIDFELSIPDNFITNNGLIMIARSLPEHIQNLKLDFKNNMLGDSGTFSLSNKISKMTRLQSIYLSLKQNKFLTGKGLNLISDSLTKLPKLKTITLDLQSMEMNNKSANKLFAQLQNLQNVEYLNIILKDNLIDPVQKLVVDMNKEFGTSEKQQVNEKGSYNLAKCIDSFQSMKYLLLDLSSNNIDQAGASFLNKSLGNLINLKELYLNLSDNYIKKSGLQQLSMSIKKLTNLQNLELILDQIKKPNTQKRREKKHKIGDQRLSLQFLIKDEERPLKLIFKKIQKLNRSKKELQKYVDNLDNSELLTLQKYVALRKNKDGSVEEPDRITRQDIFKHLSEVVESNTRSYQITNRKFSSFEDLFKNTQNLVSLQKLKMNIRSNGLVNLDLKMIAQCIDRLENLESLSLNLQMNVISDIGVKFLFDNIANHPKLKELEYDLSSNLIKFEGAEYISQALVAMSSRHTPKKDLFNQDQQIDKVSEAEGDDFNQGNKVYSKLQKFSLIIRNNKIEFDGGHQLVEMACKLCDENVQVILLMGNCNIVDPNSDSKKNDYGYFHILKKQLGQNFEFE